MTYIIAEIGSTHDGSLGNALRMVETFAELGADAVKFQDHRWQQVSGPHPSRCVHSTESRESYYKRTAFTAMQWNGIAAACESRVDLIVSPFSVDAAKYQANRVAAFKIASGEVTNLPLLEAVKATGKPVYLSSGMTTWAELRAARELLGDSLRCVMHCTSEYPCVPEHVGVNVVKSMVRYGNDAVGLSDHTLGMAASLAAITLGATVIERHVTLSRRMYGSDAAHSLEPDEFARFVREVRELDRMLASPVDKDALVQTPEIQRMREAFLHRSGADTSVKAERRRVAAEYLKLGFITKREADQLVELEQNK